MPSQILTKIIATKQPITITLASLAAAAARQSTMIANNSQYPAALCYFKLRSGGVAPTAGKAYEFYLLRGDDAAASGYRSDNAGASDAAITIENALLLGTLIVTATAAKNFYAEFDTAALGPLGPEWGVTVKNASDQALDATEGNFVKEYAFYVPEAQ